MSAPVRRSQPSATATLLAVLAFVAMSGIITVRTWQNAVIPGDPYVDRAGLHDFRDVLYYPAVALLDGRNPYDAATFLQSYPVARPVAPYLPTALLLHVPFALLPFTAAAWTHYALNTLLVLVLAWLCLRESGIGAVAASPRRPASPPVRSVSLATVAGVGAAILLSRPAHMTLYIGQCAAYLALATLVALQWGRRRPWLAGVALAIASVKPTFGVPLALVMLLRRDVRALAIGAAIAGVALAAAVAVLASAAHGVEPLVATFRGSYGRLLQDASANPASSIIRLDTIAVATRMAGGPIAPAAEIAITLVLLAAGTAAIGAIERRDDPGRLLSSTVAILTLLTCTYHQAYDGLLLVLPAVALATGAPAVTAALGRGRWVVLALLCVPALNYVATDTVVDALGIRGAIWRVVTSLNGLALLAALTLTIAYAVRVAPRARDDEALRAAPAL